MILQFLKTVLFTDVNNLFEDVSVLEHLNGYKKLWSTDRKFTIKPKNGEETVFLFSKEKTSELNLMMNSLLNPNDGYVVENQKIKLTWSRIFVDFKGKNNVALIIDSQWFECWNDLSEEKEWKFEIGRLKAVKFVKSYGSVYLYVFFENTYVKFDISNVRLIVN